MLQAGAGACKDELVPSKMGLREASREPQAWGLLLWTHTLHTSMLDLVTCPYGSLISPAAKQAALLVCRSIPL